MLGERAADVRRIFDHPRRNVRRKKSRRCRAGFEEHLFAYELVNDTLADKALDGIRLRWEPRAGESSNPGVGVSLMKLVGMASMASACSVIASTNSEQCHTDSDCLRFSGYFCDARDHVCVLSEVGLGGPVRRNAGRRLGANHRGRRRPLGVLGSRGRRARHQAQTNADAPASRSDQREYGHCHQHAGDRLRQARHQLRHSRRRAASTQPNGQRLFRP